VSRRAARAVHQQQLLLLLLLGVQKGYLRQGRRAKGFSGESVHVQQKRVMPFSWILINTRIVAACSIWLDVVVCCVFVIVVVNLIVASLVVAAVAAPAYWVLLCIQQLPAGCWMK